MSDDRYPELPPTLDVSGMARFLGVGERVVRDLITRGELGSVRVGRLVRIPRHRVLEFLNRGNGAND